jgi:sugar phosphate permease
MPHQQPNNIEPKADQRSGPYRYYVLSMLALVYAFSYMDRQILAILMEDIKLEFALNDTQLGLLSGLAFAIFYATLGLPIARLADRSNRIKIISVAITFWSVMTAITSMAGSFLQLFLVRIGVGIGEAGGSPPSHSVISDYFTPQERPLALSIYSTGPVIGSLMGLVIGGYIAQTYGWRTAFIAAGVPGIALALIVWITIREPKRLSDQPSTAGEEEQDLTLDRPGYLESMKELWDNKVYRYVNTGHLLAVGFGYSITTWLPALYLRKWELSQSEVGTIVGLTFLFGGFPGALAGGYFASKLAIHDRRWESWLPAAALVISVPLYAAAFTSDSIMAASIFFGSGVFLLQCSQGPGMAVIQSSVDSNRRAFAAAVMFFCGNMFGLGLGPLVVGMISDLNLGASEAESLAIAIWTMSLLLIPAAICYWWGGVLWGRKING